MQPHVNGLTPHSCERCQGYVVDPRAVPACDPHRAFNLRVSALQVLKDAEAECLLAKFIIGQHDARHLAGEPLWRDIVDPESYVVHVNRSMAGGHTIRFELRKRDSGMIYIAMWDSELEMYTLDDDPATADIKSRPVNINPGSDETFREVASRVSDCLRDHQLCSDAQKNYVPSRLLEITNGIDQPRIRLRERSNLGEACPYLALSYCWGGPQEVRLTESALETFRDDIPFASLPKTLQDAAVVTQKLPNVTHLWADVLCIVQDDPNDVAAEIAQMSRIYGGAQLVVAAARAAKADEGFLHPRHVTDNPGHSFQVPYRTRDGKLGSAYLFQQPAGQKHSAQRGPLLGRAWALQEEVLATRRLDIGRLQSRWSCLTRPRGRGDTDGWRSTADGDGDRLIPIHRSTTANWLSRRHRLLGAYTQRALSCAGDRSLAVSGVVARFAELHGGDYAAGLWRDAFPLELLWQPREHPRARPTVYTGPSWSWTGMDGEVHHVQFVKFDERDELTLEVLDCDFRLADERARFGAVTAATLRVKGRTKKALWIKGPYRDEGQAYRYSGITLLEPEGGISAVQARLVPDAIEEDWADPGVEQVPVVLLEVGRIKEFKATAGDPAIVETANTAFRHIGPESDDSEGGGSDREENMTSEGVANRVGVDNPPQLVRHEEVDEEVDSDGSEEFLFLEEEEVAVCEVSSDAGDDVLGLLGFNEDDGTGAEEADNAGSEPEPELDVNGTLSFGLVLRPAEDGRLRRVGTFEFTDAVRCAEAERAGLDARRIWARRQREFFEECPTEILEIV